MPDDDAAVAAHSAVQSHRYVVHFPPHPARTADPHYVDFNHYHQKTRKTARCFIGQHIGYDDCRDAEGNPCPPPPCPTACDADCDEACHAAHELPKYRDHEVDDHGEQPGLELHHAHVEFSLQQGIDLAALEQDFPGISNPNDLGAWVESDQNFRWLCVFHHRGPGGAHTSSHSDWEAERYVRGLISKAE